MKDTASENSRILMDVIIARGVETIIISPGSRNTPLIIAAEAREKLKKYVVADERTAAFMALGMAMGSRRPVALACTSGTALYNYAPAVAEAFYQKIPLIVISADRPAQWIDQDDSQTLRQSGALANIVKASFDIPLETEAPGPCANPAFTTEKHWFVNRLVNEAMTVATTGLRGPVHINIQLDNPLGKIVDVPEANERIVRVVENEDRMNQAVLDSVALEMMEKRILVVAGFMPPDDKLNRALIEFSRLPNVAVMCETLSNIHTPADTYLIDSLLARLSDEEKRNLKPDIVISIGGSLVSRMLKEYLRRAEGTVHWKLGDSPASTDTFQRLDAHFECDPAVFFQGVTAFIRHKEKCGQKIVHSGYSELWSAAREKASAINADKLRQAPWSELTAHAECLKLLSLGNINLFFSNGTPIRYSQLAVERVWHACYGNRGVSGIDGTNATALGLAMAKSKQPTLLLSGDLSFSYCPQILALKEYAPNFKIIVFNNAGGGIFRFIRTTRSLPMREEYLCAPPNLPLHKLCDAYGWNYLKAENMKELHDSIVAFMVDDANVLLEIKTDPQGSADILINFLEEKI